MNHRRITAIYKGVSIRTSKQARATGTVHRGMIVVFWVLFAGVLAWLFQGILERQWNPNAGVVMEQHAESPGGFTLKRNRMGHYVMTGGINGVSVEFLLDTGATSVAVPESLARQLNLPRGSPLTVTTANGVARAWRTQLESVSLGPIKLLDVAATINPGMDGDVVLLGMSVLKHLDLVQKGNTLEITTPN